MYQMINTRVYDMKPVETPPELKAWLVERMDAHGWSGRETAERAGLSSGMISLIMNGRIPSVEVCAKLAAVFRTTPEYVMHLAGYPVSDPSESGLPPDIESLARRIGEIDDAEDKDAVIALLNAFLQSKGY